MRFTYMLYMTLVLCDIYGFFFFNDTATTEIYTLSLHDALPIWKTCSTCVVATCPATLVSTLIDFTGSARGTGAGRGRSEEHTSELQSRQYLVCRLLLEKKKKQTLQLFHSQNPSTPTTTLFTFFR